MTQQPDLFSAEPTGPLTNKEKFSRWIASTKGQVVYDEVCSLARQLKKRGHKHYGIGAIWEQVRFSNDIRTVPKDEGFKMNNTHRAFLSRRIMKQEDDLMGFFTTKPQESQ